MLFEAHILYNKLKKLNINDIYKTEYELLISKFLNYIKNNLTTSKMASYILNKIYNKNISKILYLSGETCPDYLRCLTLHGFKTLFGTNCHDYPKIQHIYKTNDINFNQLYGKGLTYTNLLDPKLHDETLNNTIEEDIKKNYYDLIIYGSFHRGMPFYDLINKFYYPSKIVLLCGEDLHNCNYNEWLKKGHYIFVREL